jgi:hypothetical protein
LHIANRLWAKWASHTLDGLPPVEKQRWMRSFSVHADSVSEFATSSEPVSAQTKRRVVWPLKELGYARVISPDLGIESIGPPAAVREIAALGHDALQAKLARMREDERAVEGDVLVEA